MKREIKIKLLEIMKNSAMAVADLVFVMTLPYGTSSSRAMYLLEQRQGRTSEDDKIDARQRRQFSDFIYRLWRDGLISEKKIGDKFMLKLSPRGRELLKRVRAKFLPEPKYQSQSEDTLKVAIFDIPEKEKRKREWLRSALKSLKFKMIQRSVWIGKVKLPKEFISDLERINILSFVEIFAITKSGSLRQIKADT